MRLAVGNRGLERCPEMGWNGLKWAEKGLIDWVIVDVNYVAPV